MNVTKDESGPSDNKRQRFMDSYVVKTSKSTATANTDTSVAEKEMLADHMRSAHVKSSLGRKTEKEFRHYMTSKYTALCLESLPHRWFRVIFDQNSGMDGGEERANSDSTASTLNAALSAEKRLICPQPMENMWKWARAIPDPDGVRVVVVGQDPYHTVFRKHDGTTVTMADGLAFSVNPEYARLGKPLPPSLVNIMKLADSAFKSRRFDENGFQGDLTAWTENGVLPLNTTLTTVEGIPNAHSNIGWDRVTDRILQWLGRKSTDDNELKRSARIFMLWGKNARDAMDFIDRSTHVCLTNCHPSPMSANTYGWFENDNFKDANLFLRTLGHPPVPWSCRHRPHGEYKKLANE
ncbi:uracil-DNA glycosylase-like [Macrosteles quadrilineatus]|uniref:uracil-DNA glycosylase-like n=1 Tax=Macrosteles quadrilineatus TaxID=74068 RepID=UPI0023E0A7D5|nr:uracil-DNA glycosylase-like [Macrosteles quadrilineatus]